jgi:hypothetical protein
MTGKRPRRFSLTGLRVAPLCAALVAGGFAALVLADENPSAKPQPPIAATTTTRPAATTRSKEASQAEDTARVLEFFKQNQPEAYDKAVKLQRTDPAKFQQLIRPAIPIVNSLDEIKKTNPTRYALKVEDYQLTYQIHNKAQDFHRPDLSNNERDTILADLTARVTRQFEVGQLLRQQEIADIEQRVQKLQAQLEEREKNKDKSIKRRLDDLTK